MSEILRDKYGNIVGRIEILAERLVLRDRCFDIDEWYDPQTNWTMDKYFNRVIRGNALAVLLRHMSVPEWYL